MLKKLALVAALIAANALAADTDISGKWTLHVKFFLVSGDPWFMFKQEGEKLSGMYHGRFGDLPLTGTVKGNQIQFSIEDKQGTAVYQGTLSGDTMKGTA